MTKYDVCSMLWLIEGILIFMAMPFIAISLDTTMWTILLFVSCAHVIVGQIGGFAEEWFC